MVKAPEEEALSIVPIKSKRRGPKMVRASFLRDWTMKYGLLEGEAAALLCMSLSSYKKQVTGERALTQQTQDMCALIDSLNTEQFKAHFLRRCPPAPLPDEDPPLF